MDTKEQDKKLEPLFQGEDLRLIEALVADPKSEPYFDWIKACLIWNDERPDNITNEAYENLVDLWIARSFIHTGREFSSHRLDPVYFESVWNRAMAHPFNWPGFSRLQLTEREKEIYEEGLSADHADD